LALRDGNAEPRAEAALPRTGDGSAEAAFRRALRHPVFWGLALCFTAYYATFSALTFHIIPLLTDRGVSAAVIVSAIALIGPAQVAGRVLILAWRGGMSSAVSGRLAVLLFPLSILLLLSFPASLPALFAFAFIYGCGNGILTIVRGTAVPDLLGKEGYGRINGALTLPANLARAAAPFGAALVWSLGGYDAVLWSVLAGSLIAASGFWYAAARAAADAPVA
jgi:predicted MFS family arabinose efflux permease